MPFSQLPSLNLNIPQTHFQPLPARIPNQKGLLIAQALAQLAPALVEGLSPEARLRKQSRELEYKMNLQKYNYLQQHPELLGGKTDLERRQEEQSILESQSRIDERKRKNAPPATFKSQEPSHWNNDYHIMTDPELLQKPTAMIDLGGYFT